MVRRFRRWQTGRRLGGVGAAIAIASIPYTAQAQTLPLDRPEIVPSGSEVRAAAPFPESYVLGPGDRIRVDIFNVPEFSGADNGTHEVLLDGTLALPLVGLVDVQGLTLAQTQEVLTTHYATLMTRPPRLTVTLLSARPVRVVVAGEVNRPGTYTINLDTETAGGTGSTSRQWPTLTQLIQEAGGITQRADVRQVQIRRPQRQGGEATITANLWDLIRTGDIGQDLRLRDGDTVVLPTATAPSAEESVSLSTANFSPSEIPIQVVGEVARPGTVELPANATLNQAILSAGGFSNSRARTSVVTLVRLNPDGTVEQREINVDLANAADNDSNPVLRPNDVVMVDRNTLATTGDTLGVILSPLTALTAILRLFGF
ncbi:polysaccharide biosynthesis/export family protein [Nodosilinea sp. P-1105]|uniref:SLBB domain-containing protein n=1 Tax=Nodosilinea sp. P-1105 TaxID=2546229 RepID=UPI00146AA0D6|nr:polysaccharide biosynthesis/export family protein [Nodosilinea sp. P-1105]NMF82615.1 polysaccharide transporter [Nodosilinea sp. P-1105]